MSRFPWMPDFHLQLDGFPPVHGLACHITRLGCLLSSFEFVELIKKGALQGSCPDSQMTSGLAAGHSLGGALSELAAYDLAKAAEAAGLDLRLACYTIGGPRVGNHAFALDHAEVVPDTWNVINDQVALVQHPAADQDLAFPQDWHCQWRSIKMAVWLKRLLRLHPRHSTACESCLWPPFTAAMSGLRFITSLCLQDWHCQCQVHQAGCRA